VGVKISERMNIVRAYVYINPLDEYAISSEDHGWEMGDDIHGRYMAGQFESVKGAEEKAHELVDLLFMAGVRVYDVQIIDESPC
jgi:hypothetical protein